MKKETEVEKRFWSRVNEDGPYVSGIATPCWEYVPARGYQNSDRLMYFNLNKKIYEVGKVAWMIYYGEIPDRSVLRRCGNKRCVNRDHLFLGSSFKGMSKSIIDDEGKTWKFCTKCGDYLEFNEENFGGGGWRGNFGSTCKKCKVRKSKEYQTKNWKWLLIIRAKDSAQTKNIIFDIDELFLQELYDKQEGKCFWTGIPMVPSTIHRYPFFPSLDRKDRNIGYIKDNLVLCCQFMNVGRNSCSYDDFVSAISEHLEIFGNGLWRNYEQ